MKHILCAIALLSTTAASAADGKIDWFKDLEKAKAAAEEQKRLIFMDIYADWCPPCKMLEQHTFSDEAFIKHMEANYIPLKIDADKQLDVVRQYSDGSLPTLAMLTADGSLIASRPGFAGAPGLMEWMDGAKGKLASLRMLEQQFGSDRDNYEVGIQLADQYESMRRHEDALQVLQGFTPELVMTLDKSERGDYLWRLAANQFALERFGDGVKTLQRFLEELPDHPNAASAAQIAIEGTYMAARQAYEAGDYDDARDKFGRLTELKEDMPELADMAERQLALLDLIGKEAPDLQTAQWINAEPTPLDSLEGQVVLIDFFQMICPGCERARPIIESLQEELGDEGLAVVGVGVAFEATDIQSTEAIVAYVEEMDFQYPVALDEGLRETFAAYHGMGSPWTVLVGRDGTVRHAGFFDETQVEARVKALLKEPPPAV